MNEGHAAFLTVALLEETLKLRKYTVPVEADVEVVRRRCVFTTHTPVEAGHDRFSWELVRQVLGEKRTALIQQSGFAQFECPEHDRPGDPFLPLRKWCGDAARGSLAAYVSPFSDPCDYEWGPCRDVGVAAVP